MRGRIADPAIAAIAHLLAAGLAVEAHRAGASARTACIGARRRRHEALVRVRVAVLAGGAIAGATAAESALLGDRIAELPRRTAISQAGGARRA